MRIQSHIDWNELFPLLPKHLRDSMLLEAVTILSGPVRKANGSKRAATSDQPHWPKNAAPLATAGRKYIINRGCKIRKGHGELGRLRNDLITTKGDTVTFEGIVALVKGNEFKAQKMIYSLWRQGAINVVEKS